MSEGEERERDSIGDCMEIWEEYDELLGLDFEEHQAEKREKEEG